MPMEEEKKTSEPEKKEESTEIDMTGDSSVLTTTKDKLLGAVEVNRNRFLAKKFEVSESLENLRMLAINKLYKKLEADGDTLMPHMLLQHVSKLSEASTEDLKAVLSERVGNQNLSILNSFVNNQNPNAPPVFDGADTSEGDGADNPVKSIAQLEYGIRMAQEFLEIEEAEIVDGDDSDIEDKDTS